MLNCLIPSYDAPLLIAGSEHQVPGTFISRRGSRFSAKQDGGVFVIVSKLDIKIGFKRAFSEERL